MNLKKYLQQQADKDAESLLTESDRQFCLQLAQERPLTEQPQPKKRRTKLWASLGSVAAVVLAAIIIVPVAIKYKPANEILYEEENILQEDCSIEDVNSNTKNFYIATKENTTYISKLNYDSVSNDNLFYTIEVYTPISEFTLNIIINEKYSFEFDLDNELLSTQLQHYVVNYEKKENFGLANDEINYSGYISVNSETVYFEYMQLIDLGEQVFFEDIQSVLKIKN